MTSVMSCSAQSLGFSYQMVASLDSGPPQRAEHAQLRAKYIRRDTAVPWHASELTLSGWMEPSCGPHTVWPGVGSGMVRKACSQIFFRA